MLQLHKGGLEQNVIIDYADDYQNTPEEIKKENNLLRNKVESLDKKNDYLNLENKRLKLIVQEQSEELNGLKSLLSNFQSQLNGISPIKSEILKIKPNAQKINSKSKSLLTNLTTSTAKLNTSLFKFNDYVKSPFGDKKKSNKKNSSNNNKSSQKVKKLFNQQIMPTYENKKSEFHDENKKNTVITKQNILENSLTSISSGISIENAKELLYFQNKTANLNKNNIQSSLPKLEFSIKNNNMKIEVKIILKKNRKKIF